MVYEAIVSTENNFKLYYFKCEGEFESRIVYSVTDIVLSILFTLFILTLVIIALLIIGFCYIYIYIYYIYIYIHIYIYVRDSMGREISKKETEIWRQFFFSLFYDRSFSYSILTAIENGK